jgi:hypothetical protein
METVSSSFVRYAMGRLLNKISEARHTERSDRAQRSL